MPVKWKIFLALNFVLALLALVFIALVLISLFNDRMQNTDDYIYSMVFLFTFSMIALNCFLNIYILQRFFPDKLIPLATRRLHLIIMLITGLVSVALLIICLYAAIDDYGEEYDEVGRTGRIFLLAFSTMLIVQLVVLVMQGRLPGLIRRNNHNKMHSMIDSIGE